MMLKRSIAAVMSLAIVFSTLLNVNAVVDDKYVSESSELENVEVSEEAILDSCGNRENITQGTVLCNTGGGSLC